jgi:hypothetical protein
MLAFGVVCLAFDVDDDPEHMSCGGGTVSSRLILAHSRLCLLDGWHSAREACVAARRTQGGGITMIVMSSFIIGYLMVRTRAHQRRWLRPAVACSDACSHVLAGTAHGAVQARRVIAAGRGLAGVQKGVGWV